MGVCWCPTLGVLAVAAGNDLALPEGQLSHQRRAARVAARPPGFGVPEQLSSGPRSSIQALLTLHGPMPAAVLLRTVRRAAVLGRQAFISASWRPPRFLRLFRLGHCLAERMRLLRLRRCP